MSAVMRTGKIRTLEHRLCSVLLNAAGYLNHLPIWPSPMLLSSRCSARNERKGHLGSVRVRNAGSMQQQLPAVSVLWDSGCRGGFVDISDQIIIRRGCYGWI